MTEVFFYISSTPGIRARLAWRIAEKAWRQQRKVYIHAASEQDALALEALFWQQPRTAFLPHVLANDSAAAGTPVVLGFGDDPGEHHDVLINLTHTVPDFYSRFIRVAEMICGDPEQRESGRHRWKFYRDRGYPVQDHHL